MARKFRAAATRGEVLGLTEDEIRFYDALADNESALRELSDETLKNIAHELTENLRQNLSVDWSERESVRARLRLMLTSSPPSRFARRAAGRAGIPTALRRGIEPPLSRFGGFLLLAA